MARVVERLRHIQTSIAHICSMLSDKTFDKMYADPMERAAFERFIEIISEASRHIPDELKALHSEIPWQDIANTGNFLRHTYDRLDAAILRDVAEKDLVVLERAVVDLLARLER